MTDFTSTTPSSSSVDVNAVTTQLSGLQITSQSSTIVNASSVPIEKRGCRISVFEGFVNEFMDLASKAYKQKFDVNLTSILVATSNGVETVNS